MKAILHMFKGGTGDQSRATYDRLQYAFMPSKSRSKSGDRVAWIGGDLDGYGMVERKAELMALALDCGHEHLKGRRTRHLVISCEPCSEEQRADAEVRLIDSAPLLAAMHGARRWIGVIHNDTAKPHLHLILSNYDEDHERRFDFRPDFLSGLEDMNWTPHLESGKGHRVKDDRGIRGQEIHDLKMEGIERRAKEKKEALKKMHAFLKKHEALSLKQDALLDWFLKHSALPPGWNVSKLCKKSGKPRKYPVIVIDGVGLRIALFFTYLKRRIGPYHGY